MATRLLSNMVLGGGPVGGDYNAPVGQLQSFEVVVGVNVSACWYVPVDNIPDYMAFSHLEVSPMTNGYKLSIKPNRDALLRIYVFGDVA